MSLRRTPRRSSGSARTAAADAGQSPSAGAPRLLVYVAEPAAEKGAAPVRLAGPFVGKSAGAKAERALQTLLQEHPQAFEMGVWGEQA